MKDFANRFLIAVCAALFLTVAPQSASALSAAVEAAKNACDVGEQADGYLGFPPDSNASNAVRREVRDVNQARNARYGELARANGVSVEVTAALTGEKLISQAKRGQCVRGQNGQWRKI